MTDCVPGRANTTTLISMVPGMLYGQCSEICGALHGYMPLTVAWYLWCIDSGWYHARGIPYIDRTWDASSGIGIWTVLDMEML